MKVFISSVAHLLKDERNALPPFLRVIDHEPLRFEDFTSQDRSSREACLAGVDAAEVYILLLGPVYGDPFPDTGLAPTAEEFHRARSRGIPILVFNKTMDEADEPAQSQFKREVGDYVNGRFWKSFTDPMSLNIAVGEALKTLPRPNAPLRLVRVATPPTIPWLTGRFAPQTVSAPVLEAHLVPIDAGYAGAARLVEVAAALGQDSRTSGFVSHSDPLDVGSDNENAWALRSQGGSGDWQRSVEQFRGLVVTATGSAVAFVSLPTDFAGALLDQSTLQREIMRLLALATAHARSSGSLTTAVGLSAAERVQVGDPATVGSRTRAGLRTSHGLTIRVGGDFAVETEALTTHLGDISTELTIRILNDLRSLPPF
jgi:Domain of unknown function (DUF4062)